MWCGTLNTTVRIVGHVTFNEKMWVNVLKHVCNVHEWYGGKCLHGPLSEKDHECLKSDSPPPLQALREIVLDKKFLKSFLFYTSFRYFYYFYF